MGAAGGNAGTGGGNPSNGGGAGTGGAISSARPLRAINHHLISGVSLITGGAGGGGGGGGGVLYLVYNNITPGSLIGSGGGAGTGRAGNSPGVAGAVGLTGSAGPVLRYTGAFKTWE